MEKYILAIDQSTAGTKVMIVDSNGQVIAKALEEHRQIYSKSGWVEHDPVEIYENVKKTAKKALRLARIAPADLAALSITNQRETAVIWDKQTGLPIYNAIVWQCQRTADRCNELKQAGYERLIQEKTGLMLDPYFSATKWEWILNNVNNVKSLLEQGRLMAGTIDSWLVWKLTGGKSHATDFTNASRTSLFNLHTLSWDDELCRLFGIPPELLPNVQYSDDIFGYTDDQDLFHEQIPVSGVIGDSQAALFGQMCLETGMAKATYGTGTSVLMNIGDRPIAPGNGLVSTIAWGRNGKVTYAAEAIIRSSGDTLKWVKDNLGLFETYQELDVILSQTLNNEGVYLVPAFVGLGVPYWDPYVRAAILGMNRSTSKSHIVRAAVESIAYQVRDATDLITKETGIPLIKLSADGGASSNALIMQFQADILKLPLCISKIAELSAMGSIYMAGLGVGYWSSLDTITAFERNNYVYTPLMDANVRKKNYMGWKKAVRTLLSSVNN